MEKIRLLITDVTRMREGRFCVVGLDQNLKSIRLSLPYPFIQLRHLIPAQTALLRPRAVVKVYVKPNTHAKNPHVEDHHWILPEETELEKVLDDHSFQTILEKTKARALADLFGVPLLENRKVEPWTGTQSIGTIRVAQFNHLIQQLSFYETVEARWRLGFLDESGTAFEKLAITDLNFNTYADYLSQTSEQVSTALSRCLKEAHHLYLRIGLTRPFGRDKKEKPFSYLQVSSIYSFPDYLQGKCFADFLLK